MSVGTSQIPRINMHELTPASQLHAQQDHPDEGILTHVNELVAELEGKGVRVEMEDEDGDDVEMQ